MELVNSGNHVKYLEKSILSLCFPMTYSLQIVEDFFKKLVITEN